MCQKLLSEENWKNLLEHKIFKIFDIFDIFILKNWIFPIKQPFSFFNHREIHDIELTTIKISDKNIVPLGGVQAPNKGIIFIIIFKFCWLQHEM